MKKYLKYILSFLAIAYLSSCSEDWLEVKNPNSLTSDNFYQTEEHADMALVACYDPLKSRGLIGGVEYSYLHYAFDPDCIIEGVPYEFFLFTSSDNKVSQVYMYIYRGLYRTNLVLTHVPDIDMPEDKKNRYLAEARFLRAYYSFNAVVQFNEPPIMDQVYTELGVELPNSPKEEWWEFIEADLNAAIPDLPQTVPGPEKGRVTWGAAKTLLGKVHLFQQEWEQARQNLRDVIDAGVYSLSVPKGIDSTDFVYAYLCNFTEMDLVSFSGNTYEAENNSESIFEVQNNNDERQWNQWLPGWGINGSMNSSYYAPHGYRNIAPTVDFCENAFELVPEDHPAGLVYDPRRPATIFVNGDTIESRSGVVPPEYAGTYGKGTLFAANVHANPAITRKYGVRKYYYPLHWGNLFPYNDPNNWRVLRYSDVLLMYAEADYHVNGAGGDGIDYLNEVRARVGLPAREQLTPEYIMSERRVEFGLELMSYLDLVRWSRVDVDNQGNSWVSPQELPDYMEGFIVGKNEYLPIPINEINKMNGVLEQNPNW